MIEKKNKSNDANEMEIFREKNRIRDTLIKKKKKKKKP